MKEGVMYYTSGFPQCLDNLVVLANVHSNVPVRTGVDLAAGVRAFALAASTRPPAAGPVHLVVEEQRLRMLVRLFGREPAATEVVVLAAPAHARQLFWDALGSLPMPAQRLFRLLVTEVALLDGDVIVPGSGALLEQLGTVYVSPASGWEVGDVAECLVHEMTHLLLRCDENRYGHYIDPVDAARPQEFGCSAVTLSMRSPTVVFHSLVVAAEIMSLRLQRRAAHSVDAEPVRDGVHGPDGVLVERALRCADEVLQRPDRDRHFTDRAVLLMTRAADKLRASVPAKVG